MHKNSNVMGLTAVYEITTNDIVIRQTFVWVCIAWAFITISPLFMVLICLTMLCYDFIEMFIIQKGRTEEAKK